MSRRWASLLILLGVPLSARAQTPTDTLVGTVIEARTGRAVPAAIVQVADRGASTESDSLGRFALEVPESRSHALTVWAVGYEQRDTVLLEPHTDPVVITLIPAPMRLRPLTVRATRLPGSGVERDRALFEREVTPAATGMDYLEVRSAPTVVEPDVLRSLQSLPGVVALNDLAAQLHVRGGGPDQNAFYLDGARVFAPYHVFGLFGAFNPEMVDRSEFFRGTFPARFGDVLSSVVDSRQRVGDDPAPGERPIEGAGGVTLMGARATLRGAHPKHGLSWGVGARRTHADQTLGWLTAPDDFPFAFRDVQARIDLDQPGSELSLSVFDSSDRFRLFLDEAEDGLRSRWSNRAASVNWSAVVDRVWEISALAWGSRYDGDLWVGEPASALPTSSRVRAGGVRLETARRGRVGGVRTGLDIEWSRSSLIGASDSKGYVVGSEQARATRYAIYAEIDRWFGPLRLAPGLRAVVRSTLDGPLFEPRLAARLHFDSGLALSVGLARTHQFMFALRDDRYLLPGAPLWLDAGEMGAGQPARSDGVAMSLEGWATPAWSFEVGTYVRRLYGIPSWRPEGRRDLAQVAFDRGEAWGGEVFLRRHEGSLTGWVGYGLSGVSMEQADGPQYRPGWDRRHALDGTVLYEARRALSLSLRVAFGSGLPFWPPAGTIEGRRFEPLLGRPGQGNAYPVWAEQQDRLPAYLRVDLGAKTSFRLGTFHMEPYLSLLNATNHSNVLFYETGQSAPDGPPVLRPTLQLPFVPILGVDFRF